MGGTERVELLGTLLWDFFKYRWCPTCLLRYFLPPRQSYPWSNVVALALTGLVYLIYQYIVQTRWTKYFLTNMRLLETRREAIVREALLTRFMDKPLSQYLDKEVTHVENHQPIYKVRVIDPVSAEILMEFKDLNERATEILGKIGQVVRCSFCGTKNSASSSRCNYCGGTL